MYGSLTVLNTVGSSLWITLESKKKRGERHRTDPTKHIAKFTDGENSIIIPLRDGITLFNARI
jgi:hypothetical protein